MRWISSRRITGRHLLLDGPGAAVEVSLSEGEALTDAVETWSSRVRSACAALGWEPPQVGMRVWDPVADQGLAPNQPPGVGVSLAMSAPLDLLETACLVAEQAVDDAVDLGVLRESEATEARPELRALAKLSTERGWPWFADDDGFTVGYGPHSKTWPLDELDELSRAVGGTPTATEAGFALDLGTIPVVLVTGTNGKTTTARLLARMARAAGRVDGLTCSDSISVAGETVQNGDWSGPGAARALLRDPRVTFAVLETARGGLMRRGLAITDADVAVVTNVSGDHFGEYGIDTLAGMAEAKLSIARGVRPGGTLVVNGGNAALMAGVRGVQAARPDLRVLPFHDDGGDGLIVGGAPLKWAEVPITLGGLARHNVENALAAVAVARAAGLPEAAIGSALRTFAPSLEDSSGRTNLIHRDGITILLDFAHNPDGLRQLGPVARGLPAERRLLVVGQAGDRPDATILASAAEAAAYGCDRYVVAELIPYLRGRQLGEVPGLIAAGLQRAGVAADRIDRADDDVEAVRKALAWARPGDLLVLLVHERLDEVMALLRGSREGEPR